MRVALVALLIVAGLGGAAVAAPTSTPSTYLVSSGPKPQLLPTSARVSAWKPDFAAVRDYAKRRTGDLRISVIGIDGRRWGYHQGRSTPILSTIKVMFLTAYLRQIRDRELTDEDRDLLAPMIKRSAGQESKRVARIVGADAVRGLAKRAGMDRFRYRDDGLFGLSPTTAEEQARFMHKLERYLPDRHERIAFRLLKAISPQATMGNCQGGSAWLGALLQERLGRRWRCGSRCRWRDSNGGGASCRWRSSSRTTRVQSTDDAP